jgi:hypothetical protein
MRIGTILIILSVVSLFTFAFFYYYYAIYKWNKIVGCYWNLADKSSTLEAKSYYIDRFVETLENLKLAEYSGILFKTPDNNVKKNLEALKTLQLRLRKAKQMDINSFAYQKAIEQITAQEQGEAKEMIDVIHEGWLLANYPLFWTWSAIAIFVLICAIGITGVILNEQGGEIE